MNVVFWMLRYVSYIAFSFVLVFVFVGTGAVMAGWIVVGAAAWLFDWSLTTQTYLLLGIGSAVAGAYTTHVAPKLLAEAPVSPIGREAA